MRARRLVSWFLVGSIALMGAVPAGAGARGNNRYIVRLKSGVNGLPLINTVCAILGCTVQGSLDTDPAGGLLQPSSLFLVNSLLPIDLNAFLNPVLSLLGVAAVERDLPVPLAEETKVDQQSAAVLDYLWRRTPTAYYGTTVWEGYLEQPATSIVRLSEMQCAFHATGAGLVAVIDTGVDPNHPALKPVLKLGYDFTRNIAGGDETTDRAQQSAAVLDSSGPLEVNQQSAAVLDQQSAAVLDDPAHVAFGHGTMVAGVVHLVAPTAKIMPLKAFSADGTGYTSDVVRAIYYAVQKRATVINMSFSRPTPSPELKRALDYATFAGLIPVSSAGNEGIAALRYPAALGNVMGVASTSNEDTRSVFSNYGNSLVWVAAPGEGIVTTYPGGTYAAAWGTSFSTPFVSGAAALFTGLKTTASYNEASWGVAHAKELPNGLGYGRLDLYRAVAAGRVLWPLTLISSPTASTEGCEAR